METAYELSQIQVQNLVITPRLKQSLNVLQLGILELNELIEKELTENPLLEQDNFQTRSSRSEELSPAFYDLSEKSLKIQNQICSESLSLPYYQLPEHLIVPQANNIEKTISQKITLIDSLLAQIRETEINDNLMQPVAYIIGNLNDDGYLTASSEEIADTLCRSIIDVQQALEIVQSLEPAGIAARDLRECLLIQLDRSGKADSCEANILKNHRKLIEADMICELAEAEGLSVNDIKAAIKNIAGLNPFPGRAFSVERTIQIIPDILITRDRNEFVVSINQDAILGVRLNSFYGNMLINKHNLNVADRNYLNSRMRSAEWILHCLKERQQTLVKISKSLVNHQKSFFEYGSDELKPLALSDIAADTGMHESTISRAISNKFMNCPQGIVSFKSLFVSGLRAGSAMVTKRFVKGQIQSLIDNENKEGPVTDEQITAYLRNAGIDIARRTVTKYREDLRIPSCALRKKILCLNKQEKSFKNLSSRGNYVFE